MCLEPVSLAVLVLNILTRKLVCGMVYWYFRAVLAPRLGGYRLEEIVEVLEDGTRITSKLVKSKD